MSSLAFLESLFGVAGTLLLLILIGGRLLQFPRPGWRRSVTLRECEE